MDTISNLNLENLNFTYIPSKSCPGIHIRIEDLGELNTNSFQSNSNSPSSILIQPEFSSNHLQNLSLKHSIDDSSRISFESKQMNISNTIDQSSIQSSESVHSKYSENSENSKHSAHISHTSQSTQDSKFNSSFSQNYQLDSSNKNIQLNYSNKQYVLIIWLTDTENIFKFQNTQDELQQLIKQKSPHLHMSTNQLIKKLRESIEIVKWNSNDQILSFPIIVRISQQSSITFTFDLKLEIQSSSIMNKEFWKPYSLMYAATLESFQHVLHDIIKSSKNIDSKIQFEPSNQTKLLLNSYSRHIKSLPQFNDEKHEKFGKDEKDEMKDFVECGTIEILKNYISSDFQSKLELPFNQNNFPIYWIPKLHQTYTYFINNNNNNFLQIENTSAPLSSKDINLTFNVNNSFQSNKINLNSNDISNQNIVNNSLIHTENNLEYDDINSNKKLSQINAFNNYGDHSSLDVSRISSSPSQNDPSLESSLKTIIELNFDKRTSNFETKFSINKIDIMNNETEINSISANSLTDNIEKIESISNDHSSSIAHVNLTNNLLNTECNKEKAFVMDRIINHSSNISSAIFSPETLKRKRELEAYIEKKRSKTTNQKKSIKKKIL